MVPRERVKRDRRASWLDFLSGDKSAAAPATVSGEPLVRPPTMGWATEPDGSGRQDRWRRGTRPIAVSQETCRRRTNQAVGRGAPKAGGEHVCHLWRLTPHVRPSLPTQRRSGAPMTIASNLGFPRIGRRRELKSALERFWSGDLDEAGLADDARALRLRRANSFMEGMESATSRPEIA